MHLKFRRGSALLYRSTWVPKASAGNTHGFSRQTYVGSIRLDAQKIPDALIQRLTDAEMAFVEVKVCISAREVAERQRVEVERREGDPVWRVAEATRLAGDAVERSAEHPVNVAAVTQLREMVDRLRVAGSLPTSKTAPTNDPLAEAVSAVRAAAQAVVSGRYGKAPPEQVRTTRTYRLWAELFELVQGEADTSLLRALQARGFVKKRGG